MAVLMLCSGGDFQPLGHPYSGVLDPTARALRTPWGMNFIWIDATAIWEGSHNVMR